MFLARENVLRLFDSECWNTKVFLQVFAMIIVAGYLVTRSIRRPKNFPPGPRGIPFLGCVPLMVFTDFKRPSNVFEYFAWRWGPVVGFWLGRDRVVLVSSYDSVKEVFADEKLAGRPLIEIVRLQSPTQKTEGLFFWHGPKWLEQRRFFLRHLRDLGFGQSRAENLVHEEVEEFLEHLEDSASSSPEREVLFSNQLVISSINILWAIIGGKRYRRDDKKFQHLLKDVDVAFRASGNAVVLLVAFPWLRHIIPGLSGWTEFSTAAQNLRTFIQESIEEHKLEKTGETRDFIRLYLDEIEARNNLSDPDSSNSFNESQLVTSILDLFAAGTDSVSNSIGFIILNLLHHIDVQEKVHGEIEAVVGKDRLPSISDRVKLPYTEAVILEVQRMCAVSSISTPHFALADTKIQGYDVPKGTLIHCLLSTPHMEAEYWGDPYVFRPERFLTENKTVQKTDRLLSFGYGRRSCMGEGFAKNTVFLFITAIFQRYRLVPSPEHVLPLPEDVLPGFVNAHKPFRSILERR